MKAYSTRKTAEQLGVSFSTIKNWIRSGKINTFITPTKQHRITQEEIDRILGKTKLKTTAIYARVSSSKQKEDLIRQSERIKDYCVNNNYKIEVEIIEIASGLNDKRTKLKKLLMQVASGEINHVVIEHTDRLTRFGYNYLEIFFESHNAVIEVIEKNEIKEDLVKDLIDIVTCFCAKLYGRRSNKNATEKLVNSCLEELKP